jgi:hypothetical protein
VNNFLDVPGAGAGAAGGAAARPGNAAADFLQQGSGAAGAARPGAVAAAGAARPGGVGAGVERPGAAAAAAARPGGVGAGVERPGAAAVAAARPGTARQNLAQNQPARIENRDQRQGDRQQRHDEIRNQYEQNNPGSFWEENPGWAAFAVTRPFAWATYGSVGSWCGYTEEAIPYSYGENVYYADDQVYAGDQPIATSAEYADQAAAIATTAPTAAPEKGEWLPLGVFAITQDGQASGAEPTLYMQLAISKQGAISGTLKNTASGKVDTLEGMADQKSQRVAWTIAGQQRPVMETGLSNLTQDTSPALIHFADGQTQQSLMVRIPEPKQ